jgi:hypothetical protein
MRKQKDPTQVFVAVVFESGEKARARVRPEPSPRRLGCPTGGGMTHPAKARIGSDRVTTFGPMDPPAPSVSGA